MTEITGGCACGRVRYALMGEPRRLIACHCTSCQRRYGTAFGMSLFHDADALNITQGELKTYVKTADSGRKVVSGFCPECGTRYTPGRNGDPILSSSEQEPWTTRNT